MEVRKKRRDRGHPEIVLQARGAPLNRGSRPASRALVLLALAIAGPAGAGVKYGDAVPGVVRPADIETIKRVLDLQRFSIIAAVRLGAEEGREVVLAEPLSDETLKKVREGCEAGGFCPDPVGFVASRVLIVLLADKGVATIVSVQKEVLRGRRRLADLRALGLEGEILAWNGRAEASAGHVALSLTPVAGRDGAYGPGLEPPLLIRFNPDRDRFQVYDCVAANGGEPICDFRDGPED